MQFVVDEVKRQIGFLAGKIQKLVPNSRVGLVIYKDRGEEFVTRWSSLTFHHDKLQTFISHINAGGGGDYEEAVTEGLRTAMDEIEWRKFAQRVIVLVPSSPPHASTIAAAEDLIREFQSDRGVVHVLDLSEPMHREYEIALHRSWYGRDPEKISPLPQFYQEMQALYRRLADLGGGELIPIQEREQVTEQLLVAAFGPQWRKEVAKFERED
jgi:hypothetical protein